MRTKLAALLVPLLAACAAPGPATPPARNVAYACEDGTVLRVRYVSEGARVTLPDGQEVLLPQQPTASGTWYATAQHTLRGKGDEATWTVGRRVPTNCRVQR